MVKRQVQTKNGDQYMTEYRMRTPYATPIPLNRLTPSQQTPRTSRFHAAHEKSHLRHEPPDPFYHYEGRIEKKSRTQNSNQNNINHPHTTISKTQKNSSCCTIL